MKKYPAFLLTAGMICASFAVQAKEDKIPVWISDPYAVCDENAFCAVGSANNLNAAGAQARAGIAKIFQARVKSSLSSLVESNNDSVSSAARHSLSEESDVLLKTVEIKETFRQGETFYALAFLDKQKAARIVAGKIDDLDSKMEAFLQDDNAASARKAEKLYEQRRELNELMIVLTGKGVLESFSFADVFKNRKEKTKGGDICLNIIGTKNNTFKSTVKNVFKENGYIISNDCSIKVTVSVQANREPTDIEGLEKYSFGFSVKAKEILSGKQTLLFERSFSEAGQNADQALSLVINDFKQELTESIGDFSF